MIPSWANDDSNLPAFFHLKSADGSAGYAPSARPTTVAQQQQNEANKKEKKQAAAAAASKELARAKRLWGAPYCSQVKMDDVSDFSVTPFEMADEMSRILLTRLPGITAKSVITDGTACVGGNTVSFAKQGFELVQAFELNSARCELCYHNVEVFRRGGAFPNPNTRIQIFQGDCIELMAELKQDLIFLDPPWGGKDYKNKSKVLLFLSGLTLPEIVRHAARHAQYVALKLPINAELEFLEEFDVLVNIQIQAKILFLVVKQRCTINVEVTKRVGDVLLKLVKQRQFQQMLETRAAQMQQ